MPTAQTMLVSLSQSFPALQQFIVAFCYVFGFACMLRCIFHLKIYGQMRVMMSASASLQPALIYWFVGALLIFIPSTYESLLQTAFGTTQLTALSYASSASVSGQAFNAIIVIVQIFGMIAVAKGVVLILRLSQQAQPGTLGQAITHMLAGAFAINIVGFSDIVFNTIGIAVR